MAEIDPFCSRHGRRRSEHVCLYCCTCFAELTPDQCWVDVEGQKWDLCIPCGESQDRRALPNDLKPTHEASE